MATKLHTESRRHYSWWWDSHISPKNSRWLQENLADTDTKVNTIIKLLEEDADSFARRAEMYYKKRPELMKLVEDLYRAYRALAEKYDHATGALRQAHRTMAEAFPNQIPLLLSDESPCASSGNETEPHTPEAPPPLRALFEPDDLQKDALSFSTEFHVIKRNGAYSEPNDSLSSKKGLKQLNEMFAIGDGNGTVCTSEGRVRKGLQFQEEEGKSFENKALRCREENQVQEKPDASYATKGMEQGISLSSAESQNVKNQIIAESDRANKAESELQSIKDSISKLMAEKEANDSQYQISLQRITVLESQLATQHNELKRLNDEMVRKVQKLQNTEEINQSLVSEIEILAKKEKLLEHELNQKQEKLEKLNIAIEEEHQKCMQAEMALHIKEKLLTQSEEEVNHLSQETEKLNQKLRVMELDNMDLQKEICKIKEELDCFQEQNIHFTLMIKELKDKIILLEEKNRILTDEVQLHLGEKDILNQEFCAVKEDRIDLEGKHRDLVEQKAALEVCIEYFQTLVKKLQSEISDLKVIIEKHEAEKVLLVQELKDMGNVQERNSVLENSLSDASLELEALRGKILALENLHESLNVEISNYIAEKKALVSHTAILTQDVNTLSDKNLSLEKSLSDIISIDVGYLRSKLRDSEESFQLVSEQKSNLLAERNSLLSQVETLTQNVENHSEQNFLLEKSLSDVISEVQCLMSKLKGSNESYLSLNDQNSELLAVRSTLLSQVKIITQDVEKLLDKNSSLENSLSDVSSEVGCLRAKLKDTEESCHSLSHQNSGLLAERNTLVSQVEVLTQNIENISQKNASLEYSISDVNNEVESLRSKLKDFEESCQSLNDQNSSILTERNNLLSQLEILTKNVENLSEKNSLLENSLFDASSEVHCLRTKLKDSEESCKSLSDQKSDILSQRNTLVSQVEGLTLNLGKLSEKNSFLENYLTDVGTEVECLRSKLKALEESCQSLTNRNFGLLAERNTLESQVKILTQNVEELSEKNSSLKNSLSDANNEIGCLNLKLKESEKSCQLLSDQSSDLHAEKSALVSQAEVLTQNMKELVHKNSLLENSLTTISTEVGCLRSKLKDFEESCQSLSNKNTGLLAEKNSLETQVKILIENVEKLSEENSVLENSLSDASNEVQCLRSQLKESEESCQSLSDQNSDLLSERSALVLQAEVLTQNLDKLLHKNSLLENSLSSISTEVSCLRSKLKDFEESCQLLKDQNSTILAEKITLHSQVEILTQNVEKLSENNSFLENSLSDVNNKFECLRSKLNKSNKSCKSLSDQISSLLDERNNLLSQVNALTLNVENLSEKNSFMEISLSDMHSEMECSMSKLKDLEESSQLLSGQNSGLIAERITLLSQLETLTIDKEKLSEKYSLLLSSLFDASTEVESLKLKLRDFEESCKSLTDQNSGLLAERCNLLFQLEVLTKNVEKLSENNSLLENSLSDVSNEAGSLRSKLKDCEDSFQLLTDQNSCLLDKRNTMQSQLDLLTQKAECLLDKNSFLENSLSDVNDEVVLLKSKLKDYEDQNSCLLTERSTLASQVESLTLNLESLENSFVELKHNNLKSSEEKDLITNQVKDLQDLLKVEKEDYETLIRSYKSQLAALENQIFLVGQENELKEMELEAERSNLIAASIENFILRSCLYDVTGRNLALSIECQKNQQACRSFEVLISQLEQEKFVDIKNTMILSERNQKLSNGICLLQDTLNVNKKYSFSDEIQDEIVAEIVVKNILTFLSEVEHDNQLLHIEISVLVTLLKQTMLDLVSLRFEKCTLERELGNKTKELLALRSKEHELQGLNENLMKDMEASNQRERELKTEMNVICGQLTALQESLLTSECEISNLIEEKKILIGEIYYLRQKHDMLEEENKEVLAEAMKLDHLNLFFRSLSADRLLELKSFAYELDSLHFVNKRLVAEIDKLKGMIDVLKGENRHLMESLTCLEEEFKNHLLLSEFELITATCVCEELNLESQSLENQLIQKKSQLSKTNQKIESTQLKNWELCKTIEGIQLHIEAGKLVKEELELKISNLSEAVAYRNKEIRCLCKANEMLQEEIYQKHGEVEVLTSREGDLLSKLREEIDENERCEVEIELLLSEIQVSTVNAALYQAKILELTIQEEVSSMLEKEMLIMKAALIKEYMDNLKKKFDDLEGESRGWKNNLDGYASLVTSLWNGIISLEEQIMGMEKFRLSKYPDQEVSHLHCNEGHKVMNTEGVLLLEKSISKVESLQKVLIDIQNERQQEKLDYSSNIVITNKQIEELKQKELGWREEVQLSQNSIRQGDDRQNDIEISKGKSGQMMKDIKLDPDSSHLPYRTIGSYGLSRIDNDEIDDQLWEAAERNCSNGKPKGSLVAMEHDIEPVEEVKSEYPSSELMVEKELSIDKLEIPNKVLTSRQEWNKRLLGRLKTDAQRLTDLKTNVTDLKRKMESSQMGKLPANFGYDTIKSQLKDAEGSVVELINTNKKMTNKAEEYHLSDCTGMKSEEGSSTGRRQISEQARKESEKVGRLELELHKIQYVLLKLEEEHMSRRTNTAERRARTLLRDYIYGRRDGRQTKKSALCGCMKPKTKGDQ